jgi:hypothetical protein
MYVVSRGHYKVLIAAVESQNNSNCNLNLKTTGIGICTLAEFLFTRNCQPLNKSRGIKNMPGSS